MKNQGNIGGRLKVARVRADVSQDEAAFFLGTSQSHISRIERGYARASVIQLFSLCKLYGIQAAAVVIGSDEMRAAEKQGGWHE